MPVPIDYSERIPNNVGLAGDRRLQRALESWQPRFLDWWRDLGPALPTKDVYLRTAVAVGRDGWAHFAHVPMEQYRWGIFRAGVWWRSSIRGAVSSGCCWRRRSLRTASTCSTACMRMLIQTLRPQFWW